MFSAMIWTVHFAYDNVGWPSFERAAQMINDTGKFNGSNSSCHDVAFGIPQGSVLGRSCICCILLLLVI